MPTWLAPWEWTASDWAGLHFVVLVSAALVAWRHLAEARRLRRDQARPFVVVDFEVQTNNHLIFLVISNIGRTMARNVRLAFEPQLESSWDADGNGAPLAETKLLREGIPTFPPGKRIPALFDGFVQRQPEVGLPDVYHARIRYEDEAGETYDEKAVLDLGVYTNLMTVARRDLHDVHNRLEEIRNEMRKWTAGAGGGLLVLTPAGVRRRIKEIREGRARIRAGASDN